MIVNVNELKDHPLNTEIFKDIEGDLYNALKEDIRKRGVQNPIKITEKNVIINGHQRVRICKDLGIEGIRAEIIEGTEEELKEQLIKDNILRRQLNDWQIAEAGKELEKIYQKRFGSINYIPQEIEGGGHLSTPEGKTRDLVAREFGISGRTYERIKEVREKIDIMPEEVKEKWFRGEVKASAVLGEIKRIEAETPDWLRFIDIWNFTKNTGEGISNLPPEILKNLIYYYTEEGDLIYDSFAGSGQTYTIAKEMGRECICSDINPREDFIIKWDVEQGMPEESKRARLVFLDPPYWNMIEYGGWDKLELKEFYLKFEEYILKLKEGLKKGSYVALIIMPLKKEEYIDLGFEIYQLFIKNGFQIEQRLCVPLQRNWALDGRIKAAKENKKILTSSLRDLIIFKR